MKKLMMVLLVPFLWGCDSVADRPYKMGVEGKTSGAHLTTVDHDDHKFVVVRTDDVRGGATALHHPACPCLTKKN